MKIVAVFAGRFHPFHKGHKASYDHLVNRYGAANVYVVSTNTQAPLTSPFSFDDKKKMMVSLGVPATKIVQVKNPYNPVELTDKLNKKNTAIVFAVSEKDTNRFSFKPKKDGSPSYLQPMRDNIEIAPIEDHGYVEVAPTVSFKVAGESVQSASEIRQLYMNGDENMRETIITDLYGSFLPKIKQLFDLRLGITEAYFTLIRAEHQKLLESKQRKFLGEKLMRAYELEHAANNELTYNIT